MRVGYISAYGGIAGLLLGIVITLIYDMPIGDALFRIFTLTICGAWMGAIIFWLDTLLPKNKEQDSGETEN